MNSKNIPNLKEKLDTFNTEHLHVDEEIRFMIEGGGYFDIKDENDKWVRIVTNAGTLIGEKKQRDLRRMVSCFLGSYSCGSISQIRSG